MQIRTIGGHATQVVCAGDATAAELVLILPGNPGVARFYVPLAHALVQRGQGRWQVAVASHAGHAPPRPTSPRREHVSLTEQVDHKLSFLNEFPSVHTVHLIGHSIGCWMALSVLDRLPPERRGQAVLVCPTIERMAITPNGRRLTPLFHHGRYPATLLAWAIGHTPGRKALLTRLLLQRTPEAQRDVMLQSMLDLQPRAVFDLLGLAAEEMRDVVALPEDALRRHGPRLQLMYAKSDPWNLPGMAEGVEALDCGADVRFGSDALRHSFVLFGCEEVADACAAHLQRAQTV